MVEEIKATKRDQASVTIIRATDKHPQPIKCPQCKEIREYIIRCEHCGHIQN